MVRTSNDILKKRNSLRLHSTLFAITAVVLSLLLGNTMEKQYSITYWSALVLGFIFVAVPSIPLQCGIFYVHSFWNSIAKRGLSQDYVVLDEMSKRLREQLTEILSFKTDLYLLSTMDFASAETRQRGDAILQEKSQAFRNECDNFAMRREAFQANVRGHVWTYDSMIPKCPKPSDIDIYRLYSL